MRRAAYLLCASMLLAGSAFAQRGSPGPWPKQLPLPQVVESGSGQEVAGGLPSDDRRIVGIHMYRKGTGAGPFVCSGTLLTHQVVLTAAHCICGMERFAVTNEPSIGNSWSRAMLLSEFADYCVRGGPRGGNDLALLRVIGRPLEMAPLRTIAEDYSLRSSIDYAGRWLRMRPTNMRVEGYGFDGNEPGSLGRRRFAHVGVDSLACTESWMNWSGCSPLFEFVLGLRRSSEGARDTCTGDSGGPVFAETRDGTFLVGVVSRGVPLAQPFTQGRCGAGGIYVHIGRRDVIEWLERHDVTVKAAPAGPGGPVVPPN